MKSTARAKTLPPNPKAVYLTSTGWQMPDGSFKPFMRNPAPIVAAQPGFWGWLRRDGR